MMEVENDGKIRKTSSAVVALMVKTGHCHPALNPRIMGLYEHQARSPADPLPARLL